MHQYETLDTCAPPETVDCQRVTLYRSFFSHGRLSGVDGQHRTRAELDYTVGCRTEYCKIQRVPAWDTHNHRVGMLLRGLLNDFFKGLANAHYGSDQYPERVKSSTYWRQSLDW